MKELLFNKDTIELCLLLFWIIVVALIVLFTIKKVQKNDKRELLQYILQKYFILIIPFILLKIFPIGTVFFKFNSPEEAYYFEYEKGDILFNETNTNTSFLFVKPNEIGDAILVRYEKKGTKWAIRNVEEELYRRNRLCMDPNENISMYLAKSKDDNLTAVVINVHSKIGDETLDINDSYDTKFEFAEVEDRSFKDSYYFGVINKMIDDDYYVTINNKKHYINKYKKFRNAFICN